MYRSPIDIIYADMSSYMADVAKKVDEDIWQAIVRYDINIDKDELIRALQYDRDQYAKGYADGEADATPRWISVEERLPDTFGEFIVCVQNADGWRFSDYADFDPYVKKWKTGLFFGEHDKVTHWMPLPEPPSESTVTVEDECNDEDWGC